jgi:hypothetical protein
MIHFGQGGAGRRDDGCRCSSGGDEFATLHENLLSSISAGYKDDRRGKNR